MKSVLSVAALVAFVAAGSVCAAPAPAAKPVPSVEFTDPAGDVRNQNGPGNDRDVVKLTLGSDGTDILVSATIAEDEHGSMAASVVELYLDTDNNVATGGMPFWGKDTKPPKTGFEYVAKLAICTAYDANIAACAGGDAGKPPKSRHARITLDRFTGAPGGDLDMMNSKMLISGFGPADNPFSGRLLQGKIPYAKMDAKPGQLVRVSSREAAATGAESFFPDVLLALK
jgi:hypothetical protein